MTTGLGQDSGTRAAVTLEGFRSLQAAIFSGNEVAASAHFIGFGRGGHTASNEAKDFDSTRDSLFEQVVVVEIDNVSQPDRYTLRARAVCEGNQIDVLSEALLFDKMMRPMCMATFPPKFTSPGESYGITLKMHF